MQENPSMHEAEGKTQRTFSYEIPVALFAMNPETHRLNQ